MINELMTTGPLKQMGSVQPIWLLGSMLRPTKTRLKKRVPFHHYFTMEELGAQSPEFTLFLLGDNAPGVICSAHTVLSTPQGNRQIDKALYNNSMCPLCSWAGRSSSNLYDR